MDEELSELDPSLENPERNTPSDTSGRLRSARLVSRSHPIFPTYQCFPTYPHIVFRTEPVPMEAALTLPPPPSFGPEQNVGCLLGVRVTCCRQSHYLSAVVGITVVLAILGLLMLQEQRVLLQPTSAEHHVWQGTKTTPGQKTTNSLDAPRLSLQLSDAKHHYEMIIDKQAKRLNGDWLAWTKSKELSMRRRLLRYAARFKHDFVSISHKENIRDDQYQVANNFCKVLHLGLRLLKHLIASLKFQWMNNNDGFHLRMPKILVYFQKYIIYSGGNLLCCRHKYCRC